ncbi:hypothetical protein OGATHE_002735 [Ogataea polymorpha]|uniref:Protein RER1 n=1 Tax=Ogataea polymorpha TaxID=460523 RepID=A0A9P8PCV1_9ASCO|nr:hypothetical protein OGATHE_002735 [Ogataea polymorpha]
MERVDQYRDQAAVQWARIRNTYQRYLDIATPHTVYRWAATYVLMFLFALRIVLCEGWYIVCYTWAIYLLSMLLQFLTPKFDPSLEQEYENESIEEGTAKMTDKDDEFRPFIRRLPEFRFWLNATRGTVIALVCSLFRVFDIPVFWPILLIYFVILFTLTMRRQIQHMIKSPMIKQCELGLCMPKPSWKLSPCNMLSRSAFLLIRYLTPSLAAKWATTNVSSVVLPYSASYVTLRPVAPLIFVMKYPRGTFADRLTFRHLDLYGEIRIIPTLPTWLISITSKLICVLATKLSNNKLLNAKSLILMVYGLVPSLMDAISWKPNTSRSGTRPSLCSIKLAMSSPNSGTIGVFLPQL